MNIVLYNILMFLLSEFYSNFTTILDVSIDLQHSYCFSQNTFQMKNYLRHEAMLMFTKINIMSNHDMKKTLHSRNKLHIFLLHTKIKSYWSIEDMMKTNKQSILSHPRRCK